jgi:hypothetical protein
VRVLRPSWAIACLLAACLDVDTVASELSRARSKRRTPPPRREIPKIVLPRIPVVDVPGLGRSDADFASDARVSSANRSNTNNLGSVGSSLGQPRAPIGASPSATGFAVTGSETSSASGSRGTGSSTSVSDGAKVGFDESRKHTDPVSKVDGDRPKDGPGPGARGQQQAITEHPFIWPMCVFAAPGTKNANGVTDELVKMAAKCKVHLMVFPMFVKSTRGDANAVASAASQKCNAHEGLKRFGVNRATALVITDDENQPAQFCNVSGIDPKEKRGCAQSTFDVGFGVTTRLANTEGLPSKPVNQIAAAIVHRSATIQDFAYWTQGWAQVGRPPGPGGNRVGDWSMGYSDARSNQVGWDDDFCEDMRKNSFKNPGLKYDPKHDRWMMEPDDKNKLVDLFDNRPLWRQPNAPSAPGKDLKNPSTAGGATALASSGGTQSGGGAASSAKGGFGGTGVGRARGNPGTGSASGGEAVLGVTTGGGGHKIAGRRPNGRGEKVRIVGGVYGGPAAGGGTSTVVSVDRTGSAGSASTGGGEQLKFDESMTANGPTSTVGGVGGVGAGSALSGGSTVLTGGSGGTGAASGANGGELSPMDSGFFSRLNFVPLEELRRRISLLKNGNGVTTARKRGNGGTIGMEPAPAPNRAPASALDEARRAKAPKGDGAAVVNRRKSLK